MPGSWIDSSDSHHHRHPKMCQRSNRHTGQKRSVSSWHSTQSESCATCHAKFDPIGMALENFDILATGKHTIEQPPGKKSVELIGLDTTSVTRSPHQSTQVACWTTAHPSVTSTISNSVIQTPRPLARNLLQQFTVYATGTPVRFSERPQIESILDTAAKDEYRVGDLIHALVQSRLFLGGDSSQ